MAGDDGHDAVAVAVARFKRRQDVGFVVSMILISLGAGASGLFALAFCGV